jgi:hypothetical protein
VSACLHARYPIASIVTGALVVGALAAARPATAQDLTFTYRVQSTASARAQQRESTASMPNMLATVRMRGTDARVDFREGGLPMTQQGGYMLVRGAEQELVFVNPRERQAMVLSSDALGAGLGALTNNALLKMTVHNPRFAFQDLGAGERILGLPTRRVRVQSGSTVEMRMFGRTTRSSDSTVTEIWIAPRPAGLDAAGLRGWSRSFGGGVRRTNAALAAQMAEYERQFGDGLMLRSVAVMQQTDDKGRATVDTMRMEVAELSRGRVDPTVFALPAGYETVDMRQVAASADSARRARGDTGSLGDAVKQAADESVKENTTESVKNAIGGMFRRRRP